MLYGLYSAAYAAKIMSHPVSFSYLTDKILADASLASRHLINAKGSKMETGKIDPSENVRLLERGKLHAEGKPLAMYNLGQGLYLQVTEKGLVKGTATFYHRGTKDKKQYSIKMGAYVKDSFGVDEARQAILKSTQTVGKTNLKDAFDNYLKFKSRSLRQKTIDQYEYLFKCFVSVCDSFGIRYLEDVGANNPLQEIYTKLNDDYTTYVANGAFPLVKSVYENINAGRVNSQKIESPFSGTKKGDVLPEKQVSNTHRSYTNPDKYRDFVDKLKSFNRMFVSRDCLLAICYVPLRPMEMCTLRYSDIKEYPDDTTGQLYVHLPRDRNKTKKDAWIPVPNKFREIVEHRAKEKSGDYIFPNRPGGDGHVKRDSLTRVLELIGESENIVVHGLRHSFRTIADEHLGFSPYILEIILTHQIGSKIEQVYNKSTYRIQMRDILSKWGDWVDSGEMPKNS